MGICRITYVFGIGTGDEITKKFRICVLDGGVDALISGNARGFCYVYASWGDSVVCTIRKGELWLFSSVTDGKGTIVVNNRWIPLGCRVRKFGRGVVETLGMGATVG